MTEDSRRFSIELPLKVQTYDIDFAGIVSNQVYIRWLEDLRLRFLDEYFPLQGQMAAGYVPILLSTEIQYRRALRLFDEPVGVMWLVGLSGARWTLGAEISADGALCATARHECAFVNTASLRPIRLPDAFLQALGLRRG
jgi:acyl-CoA thioester hydrolase